MLSVGDKFPDFKLKANVGVEKGKEFKDVSLNDFQGKWKVVFFWPMDFTFICPTEIVDFGRQVSAFEERGAVVLGGSIDTHFVHLGWRNAHPDLRDLNLALLADTNRTLSSLLTRFLTNGRVSTAAENRHRHKEPLASQPASSTKNNTRKQKK